MLESRERELLREERLALEEHLESCPGCAAFRSFWRDLKSFFQEATGPALPAELSNNVRLRCHAELDSLSRRRAVRDPERRMVAAPWPILSALLILTGLTAIFLIPAIEEFRQAQKVTLETVLVFMVVLQNALMLFFAPVLMRRGRFSPFDFRRSQ
jgi:anti-sigma factor RsiW